MKFYLLLIVAVLSFLTTGCGKYGPVPGQADIHAHVVNIGRDGEHYQLPDNDLQKISSRPIKHEIIDSSEFDLIFTGIDSFLHEPVNPCQQPATNKQILVFVHGGLNNRETSLKRAIADTQAMQCDNIYPIFINWRSGAASTIGDHYFRIRDGEVAQSAWLTSPFYLVGDLAKTIGNTPVAWYHEGYQAVNTTWLDKSEDNLANDVKQHMVVLSKDNSKRWNFWRRAVWTVTAPFKLITTPPTFTIGKPAWDNMKRRTHTMFASEDDFQAPALSAPQTAPNGTALRFF